MSSASNPLHPLVNQNLVDTKKFFCPFLDRGNCRETSRCNFSHNNCESIKIPSDYCHFYLANHCLYGQDCKFRHDEPLPASGRYALAASLSDPESSDTAATSSAKTTSSATTTNHLYRSYDSYSQEPIISYVSFKSSSTSNSTSTSLPSLASSTSIPKSVKPEVSFARVCRGKRDGVDDNDGDDDSPANIQKNYPLCPYSSATGECQFPPGRCSYLHGDFCDLCGRPCLHPYNMEQQRQHREDCLREHEREMELSFAVQRSKDKVCGICMDTVVEKKPITSSRFGILEKCNHIFCLDCIRKWRGTKQFETRTIRACPECRVSSDFVVPSKYWIEDQDDKDKLIQDYKAALKAKPCKYFNEGKGECPFAGSCFYKHAYPDGRIAKLDSPKPRRRLHGARGQTSTVANYILWNLLTSTEDDEWLNDDEAEFFYFDPEYVTTDEDDDVVYAL